MNAAIKTSFAVRQIKRMSGLDHFPSTEEGADELALTLRNLATSEEHAEQLITSWIKSNRAAPVPLDLYRLCTPAPPAPVEDFAAKQIHRLGGLDYFPKEPVAVEELITTLRTIAPTEQEAKAIIDSWMQVNRAAPTPSDLYDTAVRLADKSGFVDPKAEVCHDCGGTGWTVLIGPVPEHLATVPSLGVVRCHCFQAKAVSA